MKNLDQIYGSLYDLFNQNFMIVGEKKNCRIALGSTNNPMCYVNNAFTASSSSPQGPRAHGPALPQPLEADPHLRDHPEPAPEDGRQLNRWVKTTTPPGAGAANIAVTDPSSPSTRRWRPIVLTHSPRSARTSSRAASATCSASPLAHRH